MSSLREIDRDLDNLVVDAAHLARVRSAVREKIGLAHADDELEGLAAGARLERARPDTEPPPPHGDDAAGDEPPPSGLISVSDEVLATSELPIVLALDPPPAHEPLALDYDSGETDLRDAEPADLAPEMTMAGAMMPMAARGDEAEPPPAELETGPSFDDPNADLAALLGESDPMRDDGAAPLALGEIEPEPTTMFTAEDAARYSRPAPALADDEEDGVEFAIDDDMIELDEDGEPEPEADALRTAPPPPRTAPPPPPSRPPSEAPPSRGFLDKLLQRKP